MSKKIILGITALLFTLTACNVDRPCTYDSSKNEVRCSEKTYKTTTINGKVWMAENLELYYTPGGDFCYDDDFNNCPKYGRLYQYSETQKPICPTGWRVPTKDELMDVMNGVGFDDINQNTGLNLVKSGFRYDDGKFVDEGITASFWSATEFDESRAYMVRVTDSTVTAEHYNKTISASIRCIMK